MKSGCSVMVSVHALDACGGGSIPSTLTLILINFMNKELYKLEINKEIMDFDVDEKSSEGGFSLRAKDGPIIKFSSSHSQDCCESVYADFSALKHYKEQILGKTVKAIAIKGVEDIGFLICFKIGYDDDIKVFIPCYNYQNGYYSSSLDLLINNGGVEIRIDISQLVEDHID